MERVDYGDCHDEILLMYPLIFSTTGQDSASLACNFTRPSVCPCMRDSAPYVQGSIRTGIKWVECDHCVEEEESCMEGTGVAHVHSLEETLSAAFQNLPLHRKGEQTRNG